MAANQPIGGACTTGQADGVQTTDGNNVVCLGSVWQYPAYQFGTSTATCNSTNKGVTRYNSGILQYCDSSAWQTLSSSGNGGMILISTQTANNSATLQWTGLGSTYNFYKLYCYGLSAVNNANQLVMQVGEGAGPTWQTTNHAVAASEYGNGSSTYGSDGTNIPLTNTDVSNGAGAADAGTVDATIYSVPSTTLLKDVVYLNMYRPDPGGGFATTWGGGYHYGDNNALTAIKIFYTSGNINAGSCSLYGVSDGGGGAAGGGAGSVPLSALTAALSGGNFDNAAYAQTWTWNSLTTGTAMTLSSNSLTSGNVVNVSTSSASNSGYAGYFANSGASNTGSAIDASNSSATGWAFYADGTSPNYFAGNVGIGTTAPEQTLDVRGGYAALQSTGATSFIIVRRTATNGDALGDVSYKPSSSQDLNYGRVGAFYESNGNGALYFRTLSSGTDAERVRITSAGNVGIGTTAPLTKLEVDGQTYFLNTSAILATFGIVGNDWAAFYDPGLSGANGGLAIGGTGAVISANPGTATMFWNVNSNKVGIATTSPANTLDVNGTIHVATLAANSATSICRNANVLSSCSSSIRYKEKVKTAPFGLQEVLAMRPVTFKWKGRDENDLGLIAEEMEKINPLFVTYERGQIEGVKYSQLTAVLVKAVQELKADNDNLRGEVEKQDAELAELRKDVAAALKARPDKN